MSDISGEAYRFAKKNKKQIIKQFINEDISENSQPVFIFMAGAPGAGKTEFSKNLINILHKKSLANGIVRIDADEIRKIFIDIGYNGKNSDSFKRVCVKGVEILYDRCLKKRYHTVVDGTLSSLDVANRNIKSALKINAIVYLVYVYQDPVVAWGFTKMREEEEGRRIEKKFFIESLFKSKKNVNKLKEEYGNKMEIWLVERNIENKYKHIKFNINNLDNHLKISYNNETLNKILI